MSSNLLRPFDWRDLFRWPVIVLKTAAPTWPYRAYIWLERRIAPRRYRLRALRLMKRRGLYQKVRREQYLKHWGGRHHVK